MSSPPPREPSSIWQVKPWWCQPWSILLTGVVAVVASWLVFGRWWISLPVAMAVGLWWWLFLVLMPSSLNPPADPSDPG